MADPWLSSPDPIPIPVTQLTTPSGNPASEINFMNSKVEAEVNSEDSDASNS